MTKAELFIKTLKQMNKLMKADIVAGRPWKYTNNTSKKKQTFDAERASFGKNGKKACFCNCVDGVQWGLLKAGLIERSGLSWFGAKDSGIYWLNDNAQKNAEKWLIVKKIGGTKTIQQLKDSGELQPGDIVTYVTMSHTNVFLGGNKWFDAGHATCTKSGDGAPYRASGWVCTRSGYNSYRVGYILRIKDNKKYTYRVRLGIYSVEDNAKAKQAYMAELKYGTFREQQADGWHVYCGSYSNKSVADEKVAELARKKIPAEIETKQV